jgi:type IV pilus assembly protein PilA
MIKKFSNKKGFTLIELLIVIAILGVLAVIAFQAFGGILTNTKEKADFTTASQIEKAVSLLISESGVSNITVASTFTTNTAGAAAGTAITNITPNAAGLSALLVHLQQGVKRTDPRTGKVRILGPYLKNNATTGVSANAYYIPQFSVSSGGTHTGFNVTITQSTGNVVCKPTTAVAGSPTIGIRIN